MSDRRFEPRWPIETAVELRWTDLSGSTLCATGVVEDLSYSGVRVRLPIAVKVTAAVAVVVNGRQLRASVRRCQQYGTEFIVGLYFESDCQGVLRRVRTDPGAVCCLEPMNEPA